MLGQTFMQTESGVFASNAEKENWLRVFRSQVMDMPMENGAVKRRDSRTMKRWRVDMSEQWQRYQKAAPERLEQHKVDLEFLLLDTAPDWQARGSIEYHRDCIRHIEKALILSDLKRRLQPPQQRQHQSATPPDPPPHPRQP